jgi:hypothetical protein
LQLYRDRWVILTGGAAEVLVREEVGHGGEVEVAPGQKVDSQEITLK